jgi:hypothetical protein
MRGRDIVIMSDELLMLKNGQMLSLRDTKMGALREDLSLLDGTRIAVDGRVIMSDGTYQSLVEGQTILVENRDPLPASL